MILFSTSKPSTTLLSRTAVEAFHGRLVADDSGVFLSSSLKGSMESHAYLLFSLLLIWFSLIYRWLVHTRNNIDFNRDVLKPLVVCFFYFTRWTRSISFVLFPRSKLIEIGLGLLDL